MSAATPALDEAVQRGAGATRPGSLYEPALDGLRLVAFLAVFFHHLPALGTTGVLAKFNSHGWSGVELFFVISSFLLFRLLDAEHRRLGTINLRKFYIRRVLRIYPLMICFTLLLFVAMSDHGRMALFRLVGVATFADNLISAVIGYNVAIPYTAHLWTLGFEFQFYLCLPFCFLAWKTYGTRRFLIGLGAFYLVCVLARTVLTALGAPHPMVWVTPALQPDAMLFGIVLATGALDRVPRLAWPAIFVAALVGFLMVRPPWTGPFRAIFSYALIALASGALVQSVRVVAPLGRFFSLKPIVYLGTISFGLYVFHSLCIGVGSRAVLMVAGQRAPQDLPQFWLLATVALASTILVSALSYRFLERPFLQMKDRFSIVHGRDTIEQVSR